MVANVAVPEPMDAGNLGYIVCLCVANVEAKPVQTLMILKMITDRLQKSVSYYTLLLLHNDHVTYSCRVDNLNLNIMS